MDSELLEYTNEKDQMEQRYEDLMQNYEDTRDNYEKLELIKMDTDK